MLTSLPEMAQTQVDVVSLAGGFDQLSSGYQLPPGALRDCLNFACRIEGGYYRIPGYERFDGQPSPSSATFVPLTYTLNSGKTIAVGDEGDFGSLSGTISYIDAQNGYLSLVYTGASYDTVFVPGPIIIGGDQKGTANAYASGLSAKDIALNKAAAADIYRAVITAVPGEGPILGVCYYNDTVFAFRNNVGQTEANIYKSSVIGWEQVQLGQVLAFTGMDEPPTAEGVSVTDGSATATIERWVVTSGDFLADTAAGYLILSNVVGTFSAGTITFSGGTATIAGASTQITLLPDGQYNFNIGSFAMYDDTGRIYGADGVNAAFEFDGEVYTPIPVDSTIKPKYAVVHSNHLFLSVRNNLINSALGNPYNFEVILGAGEINVGGEITGMLVLPGNQGTAALEVTSADATWILYGTSSADWKLVSFNVGVGALDRTLQNLFDGFAYDNQGTTMLRQSLNYGNFDAARLTHNIQRFIRDQQGYSVCSGLNRENSQYRVFYSNGYGIYSTITPQGLVGHGIVLFPNPVVCAFDGNASNGQAQQMFGTADGFVMHNDKGTSFDGENIVSYFNTNINAVKSPRIRKRFRRCILEVTAESYADLQVAYSFEWSSSLILPHSIVNSKAELSALSYWDSMIWDAFSWDGRFTDAISVELNGTGENLQLLILGSSDYVGEFTLPSATFSYTPRRVNR